MKVIKFLFKAIAFLLVAGFVIFKFGPTPPKPTFAKYVGKSANSLLDLEADVASTEKSERGIKPNCQARIVWADSLKTKTKVVFLYLHGFGASEHEGAPLPENLAKNFKCNLFLARLDEHGVDEGDDNLKELTADSYVESAEKALFIAQQLGDSVVILGTSGGGGLALFLASRHPELKGLVTWSPAIKLYDPNAALLAGPWGLQLARLVAGSNFNDWKVKVAEQTKYWTTHQTWEGIVQFGMFLKHAMVPETFAKIKCPVFVGYYYENEENQDKLVSVAAMREMFSQLGTPANLKKEMSFPNTKNHIIGCALVSQDWQTVEKESAIFLSSIITQI
jgi:esterase/lipase